MDNRKSYVAGFFIIVAGILILLSVVLYAESVTNNLTYNFTDDKAGEAQSIYRDLKSIDFEKGYPETPDELMDVYCDTVLMLYGDFIENEQLYQEIIDIQRQMLADGLLRDNTFESQLDNVTESLQELYAMGTVTASVERGEVKYLKNNREACVVPVKQYVENLGVAYWNYVLENIDGKWTITRWEIADAMSGNSSF